MKRSNASPTFFNPLALWTDLAMKTAEMMVASAQVIGHRTTRMAKAGPSPSARDRKEFALMGQEKLEAARESAQAMSLRMFGMNQRLGTRAVAQMLATTSAMMALAGSRTPGQSVARHAALMRSLAASASTAAQVSHAAATVAKHGLKPIHSRATSNARRLSKR
ncbi:MAG: polyhydroxyalkanoate granule-associated phasin [Betaproteobacteria bacterium]